jgi:mannose-1-phosphate guanylyltransferase
MMKSAEIGKRWALILAAGDGTRLAALTDSGKQRTPKQFCSLRGGRTLLEQTIDRAERVVSRRRIVTVVAAQHTRFWRRDLLGLDPWKTVVQPENRGTAAGILLPVLEIERRDPLARLVLLPSDHFVADEAKLAQAIEAALAALDSEPDRIFLLGITPDGVDAELGFVVPGQSEASGAFAVEAFHEKPGEEVARRLTQAGALWNSFILVARSSALIELYRRFLPALLAELEGPTPDLISVYRRLESADFSSRILQAAPEELRLIAVPHCGWSDLGTPERVARCLEVAAPTPRPSLLARSTLMTQPPLSLALALRSLAAAP